MEYGKLLTEERNPNSMHIDKMSTMEMLECINRENRRVEEAVEEALPQIAQAVDRIFAGMNRGGRLIYTGCGTSGRLGVLDALECPPTYGVDPGLVVGVISGGESALRNSVEGMEDSFEAGVEAMKELALTQADTVVGISAAGGAGFVLGCIACGKEAGAATVGITCNPGSPLAEACGIPIELITGPEVVTGSTRMKAGTAQKVVLNMLSTCAMIQTGKVRENLMINVAPDNLKLRDRAERIVQELCACTREEARKRLEKTGYHVARALDLPEGE